jgi:hypothetical protein
LTNYWVPIGKYEDEWDAILRRECGFREEDGYREQSGKWVDAMLQAAAQNGSAYQNDLDRDKAIAKKMLWIVEEETRAAKLEGQIVARTRRGKPGRSQ